MLIQLVASPKRSVLMDQLTVLIQARCLEEMENVLLPAQLMNSRTPVQTNVILYLAPNKQPTNSLKEMVYALLNAQIMIWKLVANVLPQLLVMWARNSMWTEHANLLAQNTTKMDQVILLTNVSYVPTLAVPATMLLRNIRSQMEISHVLPHAIVTNSLTLN
jgi:hypothetical protein